MGLKWFVLRAKPRSESLAVRELERDDLEVFAPMVKRRHVRSGPDKAPLFPGYLFVRCDPENNGWPYFRPGQHLLGWVNFRGEVPWLPDEVIANLKLKCDEINQEGGMWRQYKPGEIVRVDSAAIQSFAQVLEDGKTARSRVKVLLNFLDRMVPAQVSREDIQPIEGMSESKSHPPRRTRGRGRWIDGFRPTALATG